MTTHITGNQVSHNEASNHQEAVLAQHAGLDSEREITEPTQHDPLCEGQESTDSPALEDFSQKVDNIGLMAENQSQNEVLDQSSAHKVQNASGSDQPTNGNKKPHHRKNKDDSAFQKRERPVAETWKPTHPHQLEDGKTHINIDARGQTELGRMLVHTFKSNMIHPTFGPFNSIEGFWAYIRSNVKSDRDRFRYVSGTTAKRESRIKDPRYIQNFHDIIIEANYFKILQNEKLKKLFIESTLPFDSYYIFHSKESKATEGMLVRPQIHSWLMPGFEKIRRMIREERQFGRVNYGDLIDPQPASDADLNKLQSKFNSRQGK